VYDSRDPVPIPAQNFLGIAGKRNGAFSRFQSQTSFRAGHQPAMSEHA
jgi:hypothetical protein